jgi:hypothetical protein
MSLLEGSTLEVVIGTLGELDVATGLVARVETRLETESRSYWSRLEAWSKGEISRRPMEGV